MKRLTLLLPLLLMGCAEMVQREAIERATADVRAAATDCRAKRDRGEFSGAAAFVRCSNPGIAAAWRRAGHPHLDLIEYELAARLVAAERIDRGEIAESQATLDMAELKTRLNNEMRRRNIDGMNAASLQAVSSGVLLQGLGSFSAANRPYQVPFQPLPVPGR
jgi:hypothetical protein